VYNKTFKN